MKSDNNEANVELIKHIEKFKDRVREVKLEKNVFLGEYKERVLGALTREQVKEKGIYPEIEKILENKEAEKMIISREIDFNDIKKYISLAKKKNISYKMIDGLLYTGEIGLVIASSDALSKPLENPVIKTKKEKFEEKKLSEIYYQSMGSKICDFHKEIIDKELPEYKHGYEKIGIMDSLFGTKCPICEKLGGKKRG
ncbi:DUF1694 domain-containing protein [Leptotrichia sp. OH3620_COT-345]|uniref:DUF1694 domain-containing protein n=1 Tax=Leptotrichia sp. OH3620_COT-345 TaxID=2491048 RepID=UPI000F6541F8|nr:DUF1694 domain-containing protein [Leptotrichia sp. OH3620_COT-345]RRD40055.1 DUF1694 domain-containing protein [Leptotrichia sp. OH3620_COT-345]